MNLASCPAARRLNLGRISGLAGMMFGLSGIASAQTPAFEGSLAEYLELDTGVIIGNALFSDFQLLPLQEGATGFFSDFIDVVPVTSPGQPGFRFEVMDGVTAEDFFQLRFSFRVSGVFVNRASLSLFDATVGENSNAGVDTLIDLRSNGDSLATLFSFVAPEGIMEPDSTSTFSPSNDIIIEFDAVIDGGNDVNAAGIVASLGSISLQLEETAPPAPVVVKNAGLLDPVTYVIEFTSDPSSMHVIKAAPVPGGSFPTIISPSGGSIMTDSGGYGRVEFNIAELGRSHFFRIEKAS